MQSPTTISPATQPSTQEPLLMATAEVACTQTADPTRFASTRRLTIVTGDNADGSDRVVWKRQNVWNNDGDIANLLGADDCNLLSCKWSASAYLPACRATNAGSDTAASAVTVT